MYVLVSNKEINELKNKNTDDWIILQSQKN